MIKHKILSALFVIVLLASFFIPFVSPAYAETYLATITGSTLDATWEKYSVVSYANARDSATSSTLITASIYTTVGQGYTTLESWDIFRGSVIVDTSSIPDTATINSVILKLYGVDSGKDTTFNIVATEGMPTYPHNPTVAADYARANYNTTDLGSISSTSWSDSGWNSITLTAAGIAKINKTGITSFMLRTSHDINNQIFAYDNYVDFYSADKTGYEPRLEINYTTIGAPSVTTSAASGVSSTSANLNGSLTSLGGDTYTNVRFNYGTTYALASSTAWQTKYATGSFSAGIASLTAATTYYFQAEGTNSAGVSGYGSVLQFTTLSGIVAPTVATYGADSEAETIIRLIGYLTADGGTSCSVRFEYGLTGAYGSYTDLQSGFTTGSYFYATITGLNKGDLYYFRAVATNSAGTGNGAQAIALTYPSSPTGLTITSTSTQNALAWTKTSDIQKTLIRFSTTNYPQNITDGTQCYFDVGTSYAHPALTNGLTYFYTVWGYATEGGLAKYSYNSISGYGTPNALTTATTTTLAATAVGTTTATLHGRLSSLGGYGTVDVSFQYYTGAGAWTDNETTPVAKTVPCDFSADITTLAAATLYNFRVKATNGGGTAYSTGLTFTTSGYSAPTMTTSAATLVTKTTAKIQGVTTADGGATVTVWFEWGTTTAFGETSGTVGGQTSGSTMYMNLDGLTPNTLYYFRIVGSNSAGTAYGATLSFTTLPPDLPTVSTQAATEVGSNTATLRGVLQTDGGANCDVQFQWYITGGSWSTATATGWQTGKMAGDSFSFSLSGLSIGNTYYVRAQAKNSTGTASGETQTFLTKFSAPTNFEAMAKSSSSISVSWTKQGDQTLLVYNLNAYPATRTDGVQGYFGVGTTFTISGLTAGKTYYFSAWSWATGDTWSGTYSTALATTLAIPVGGTGGVIVAPPEPGGWFTAPDYTKMSEMPLYDQINIFADSLSIPRNTFWLLDSILLSILIGSIALFLAQSLTAGAIVLTAVLLLGFYFGITPMWMVVLTGIGAAALVILDRRGVTV